MQLNQQHKQRLLKLPASQLNANYRKLTHFYTLGACPEAKIQIALPQHILTCYLKLNSLSNQVVATFW